MKRLALITSTVVFIAAPFSVHWTPEKSVSLALDSAQAVIGRPLTPGSVAGVHRRVHRRAARRYYYHGHWVYY